MDMITTHQLMGMIITPMDMTATTTAMAMSTIIMNTAKLLKLNTRFQLKRTLITNYQRKESSMKSFINGLMVDGQ